MNYKLSIPYRLPIPPYVRAVVETDYRMQNGRVLIDGREAREWNGLPLALEKDRGELALEVGGVPAVREDRLRAPPSRSAWVHAFIALFASFAGFVASGLYLVRAENGDAWSLKMAMHMAGWHLLLTLTLFPASVWGQRIGIRAVQVVSAVFFAIHAGIAIANVSAPIDGVALFNAISGAFFLAAVFYGQRAHRDMDPMRALALSADDRDAAGAAPVGSQTPDGSDLRAQ